MGLKNKNQTVETKETFSVAKEVLYPNLKTGHSLIENSKDATLEPTVPNTFNSIASIDLVSIKKIENTLKLTFLSEKDEESKVCMANNPEVRDEFKDIFDIKDLLNYSYAVLHSPKYLEKYKDLSKMEFFQVSYPNDASHFWKLVDFGAQLLDLKLRDASSVEKFNNEIDEILKKIAAIKVE